MSPCAEWLQSELCKAILRTYEDDKVLLRRDACERSVMFRIGRYLAPVVEEHWEGHLWVDCEYNRVANSKLEVVKKQVPGLGDLPDEQRSVFPDLIVHDRSGSSRKHNILIVEAKKSSGSARGADFDRCKLTAYQHALHYQHAVFLELGRNDPQWEWIGIDDEPRPVAEA